MAEVMGIIGSVGAIVNIIDATSKVITAINDLRARWKDADLSILSLASQLTAFRAALRRIQEWIDTEMPESHHQLVMDLDNTLSCCAVLVDRIEGLFSDLDSLTEQPMDAANRWKAVFGNKSVENVLMLVERQTNALTLLFTACNCATMSEQKRILEKAATRKVFQRAKTDTTSLIVHRDSSSLRSNMTDNLSKISLIFDFDPEVFSSNVYYRALRGSLKDLLRGQEMVLVRESVWIQQFKIQDYAPQVAEQNFSNFKRGPSIDKNLVLFNQCCGIMFDDCVKLTQHIIKRLPGFHLEGYASELPRDIASARGTKSISIAQTFPKNTWHHPLFESALGLSASVSPQSHVMPGIFAGLTVARFVVREFSALRLGRDVWQKRLNTFCAKLRDAHECSQSRHLVENDMVFRLSLYTIWDNSHSHLTILLHWKLAKMGYRSRSPSYAADQDLQLQFQIKCAQLHKPSTLVYVLIVDGTFLSRFEDAPFPIAESFSKNPLNSFIADITRRFHEITPDAKCQTFLVWDILINREILSILNSLRITNYKERIVI